MVLITINRLSRWDKSWYDKPQLQSDEGLAAVVMSVESEELEQVRWSE